MVAVIFQNAINSKEISTLTEINWTIYIEKEGEGKADL